MAEPADMIVALLREIRSDLAAFRKESGGRLTKLQAGQCTIHSGLAGESVAKGRGAGEQEMIPATQSVAAQLKTLKSRGLPPAHYLDEQRKLADAECDSGAGVDEGYLRRAQRFEQIDGLLELRNRIAVLNRNVCELEALQ